MKFFLDTANINEVEKWESFIQGVTSNPLILSNENMSMEDFYLEFKNKFRNIFIQIHSFEDTKKLPNGMATAKIIFKVPLVGDGFDIIKKLNSSGYRTCGTTTYDIIQFTAACEIGCEYCIVLCAKNSDRNFLEKCITVKKNYKYKTKIIAASFREKNDVEDAILCGADYLSIPPKVMEKCFYNPYAITDYNTYEEIKNERH